MGTEEGRSGPGPADAHAELRDTEYILKASVTRLLTDRRRLISAEMEAYVQGQEAKLIKLFARVLFILRSQPKVRTETSLELWLSVVNVSVGAQQSLGQALTGGLVQLLSLTPAQLADLARDGALEKEDARRFVQASTHLRDYFRRWIELGREPEKEAELSTSKLCWISYARPGSSPSGPIGSGGLGGDLERNEEARRSVSESGMDSGASDSGLGSNVSQNSLPTTTPPPSPMWAVGNSLSIGPARAHLDWNQLNAVGNAARHSRGLTPPQPQPVASAATPRTSNKSSSSTPPPSLKWGTGIKPDSSQAPPTPDQVATMTRSHSHESNLQNRIHRVQQPEMASARLLSTGGGRGLAKPATLRIDGRRPSGEVTPSCLVVSPDESSEAFLSPSSPGPPSASVLRSRTPSMSSQTKPSTSGDGGSTPGPTAGPVPRSPRTGGRIFHAIPHHFRRKILNPSKPCIVCKKNLGIRGGERCKSCRMVVHTECKRHMSEDTCGLTPQHVKSIIGLLVDPPPMDNPALSPEYQDGGTDSSSCNSSQPSTPAPPSTLPSPYPYSQPPRKFTFPELPEAPEVPNIRIDEASSLMETRSSDNSTIQGSVAGLSSQGSSGSVSGSVHTYAADGSDGPDGQDDDAKTLAREPSLLGQGWREVTISLADINFSPNSKLKQGMFGETHRGYHHQDVAVKFLDMDHVAEAQRLAAFKAEVGVIKHTRHENVVLFMGYCLEPERLGIVLNFCNGFTLHTLLHEKRERPDLPRIITIGTQIGQGMSYLHGKSILSKDLRSKNVFVQPKGKVVISDFGLFSVGRLLAAQAKNPDGSRVPKGLGRSSLRVPDHWLCYQSPQVLRSLCLPARLPDADFRAPEIPFTKASDMFAFGTIWFEMLVGEFPWKGVAAEALVWQVCSGLRPPLHALGLPKELKDLVLLCWRAHDPPSFAELIQGLERLPRKARPLTRSPSHPVSLARSAESLF